MATASKKSADYDPIEEALDLGYSVGRGEERKRRGEHVERARRGGARHGSAERGRQAEEDRKRRAKKTREANARLRANRAVKAEEEKAAARRGAYRSGQAAQRRAQEDARRQARQVSSGTGRRQSAGRSRPTRSSLSAPSTTISSSSLPTATGVDKTTSSRVILLAIAVGAIGVVAHDAIVGGTPAKTTVTTKSGAVITVPTHLRSVGGVLIMGTVALIVNEFDPGIGLLLGVGILLDVGVATLAGKDGVFSRLGGGLFAGTPGSVTHPAGKPKAPTSSPSSGLAPGAASGGGSGGGGGGSW